MAEQTKFGRMVSSQSPQLAFTYYAILRLSLYNWGKTVLFGERLEEFYLGLILRKKNSHNERKEYVNY